MTKRKEKMANISMGIKLFIEYMLGWIDERRVRTGSRKFFSVYMQFAHISNSSCNFCFSTIVLLPMCSIWVYMHPLHSLPLGKIYTLY